MERIEFKSVNNFINADFNVFEIFVTPKIAQQLLSASIGNRRLDKGTLQSLERDMINGTYNYRVFGSGIAFNRLGLLVNGHHTLNAIINTDKSTFLQITLGSEDIEKGDTGKRRSLQDSAIMGGFGSEISKLSKLGANCLRITHNIPITNVGIKHEIDRKEILDFTRNNYDILNEIYNKIISFKKINKDKIIKRYPKIEPSVIGCIIWDMIVNYKFYSESVYEYVLSCMLRSSKFDNIYFEKLQSEIYNDSTRTNKMKNWWTFEEFKEKIINNYHKVMREK
jgi:hypothetical protein